MEYLLYARYCSGAGDTVIIKVGEQAGQDRRGDSGDPEYPEKLHGSSNSGQVHRVFFRLPKQDLNFIL